MASLQTSIMRRLPRMCTQISNQIIGKSNSRCARPRTLSTSPNFIISRNLYTSRYILSPDKVSTNFIVQNEEDFEKKVLKSSTPTVVDFHAEWCGPCKTLGPIIEKAVDQYDGKILLAKVDIDQLSDIAMRYNVQVVPTVVGFKDGEVFSKFEGNLPEIELSAFLEKLLAKC